ncbi:glycine cleavage system P-protein-domain-containing protein [Dipodascopsis tothii]|uniref:glycine cleavage system P-protein-domain-containing protein n=1 Tax=Dipodascopsis tothii TaxID=44089 RepID=UPI0034CF3DA6
MNRILFSARAARPARLACASLRRPLVCGRRPLVTGSAATAADGVVAKATSIFELGQDGYAPRHLGSSTGDQLQHMLACVGRGQKKYESLDAFVADVVPESVLSQRALQIEPAAGYTETELLQRLRTIADQNQVLRSYIGMGYYNTKTPKVILRNMLECPEWYTSYTPYQPEISQGRLESLINYQTLVTDLTGMDIANASLLDEATAGAEAMLVAFHHLRGKKTRFFVDAGVHPQTIDCVVARGEVLGLEVVVGDAKTELAAAAADGRLCGAMVQYPATDGTVADYAAAAATVHGAGGLLCVAADLLALTVLAPPSSFGADIVFGSSQRFGVPLGYGGPHAAFFAARDVLKRKIPGRIIGLSKDRLGKPAYRLSLQTREQHIRREKATSNICTAQALLANMAAMYAVYHGPTGLQEIARRVHATATIAAGVLGPAVVNETWFDTLTVATDADAAVARARLAGINLRRVSDTAVGVSFDETVTQADLVDVLCALKPETEPAAVAAAVEAAARDVAGLAAAPAGFARQGKILDYAVFNSYHTETEMLRYMHRLQAKDLSLANSMIPLGSCTMKLNATTQMIPVSWESLGGLHPFVPRDQARGYETLVRELEADLADITGFAGVSLQPNSGAQGEYTGLRVIRAYLDAAGQGQRDVCLIPVSAHGTNPASAAMAGMKVVPVNCLAKTGELDLADLEAKAAKHADRLAAFMITYPSTFGVFEDTVKRAIAIVHGHGGQVYMDGANMNAQIGLCSPGDIGADVCHLNLHKTFCIPHGGGGPGVGPICVAPHLVDFLPRHTHEIAEGYHAGDKAIAAVSAAPWGSASILPISWAYIKMMGARGLANSTKLALLNANYMAARLADHYRILYTNKHGLCAHEFILDVREFAATAGVEAIDIAKRLQDYGFHAPTMSWPVTGTLMVEPTESESIAELDRFCDALIQIRAEIADIAEGRASRTVNLLKMAPHSLGDLVRDDAWADRGYSRDDAAYPLPWVRERKFWPSVTRLDDAYGDLNLFCTCGSVEDHVE